MTAVDILKAGREVQGDPERYKKYPNECLCSFCVILAIGSSAADADAHRHASGILDRAFIEITSKDMVEGHADYDRPTILRAWDRAIELAEQSACIDKLKAMKPEPVQAKPGGEGDGE